MHATVGFSLSLYTKYDRKIERRPNILQWLNGYDYSELNFLTERFIVMHKSAKYLFIEILKTILWNRMKLRAVDGTYGLYEWNNFVYQWIK